MEGTLLPKERYKQHPLHKLWLSEKELPPQWKELQNFEKDLLNTIKLIKSRIIKDNFQRKLKDDILNIKSSPDVYAFADKTTNIYKFPPQEYRKLLHENISKSDKNHQPVWKNL